MYDYDEYSLNKLGTLKFDRIKSMRILKNELHDFGYDHPYVEIKELFESLINHTFDGNFNHIYKNAFDAIFDNNEYKELNDNRCDEYPLPNCLDYPIASSGTTF